MNRGDTFIVYEERFRGCHFTCFNTTEECFFAADTAGRKWKFEKLYGTLGLKYKVHEAEDNRWRYRGTIKAEKVAEE